MRDEQEEALDKGATHNVKKKYFFQNKNLRSLMHRLSKPSIWSGAHEQLISPTGQVWRVSSITTKALSEPLEVTVMPSFPLCCSVQQKNGSLLIGG